MCLKATFTWDILLDKLLSDRLRFVLKGTIQFHPPTCVEPGWLAHKQLLEKCTPSWKERKAELTRRFTGWPLTRPLACLLTFSQWRHLNEKLGEEKEEERSTKRGGGTGECLFLMDEVFSCYIWREHSCEELLSTRKQAVCFRQACRAPGPTSHLYSSDTWSQPDNTCGSRARSAKKWEIFSTRTKNNPLSIPLGPLLVLIHLVSLCLVLVCVLFGRGKSERREWGLVV